MSFFHELERSLGGWRHKNRQPGIIPEDRWGLPEPNLPECPHYSLIEICAALTEINPRELRGKKEFCGQMGESEDSIGPLSGFRGVKLNPKTTCAEVHDKLQTTIEFMEQSVSPETEEVNEILSSLTDPRYKKKVLDEHVKELDILREQKRIFTYWQNVIFETCCVPAESQPIENRGGELPEANLSGQENKHVLYSEPVREDPHFRRLNSPEELTDEEVMMRVKSFLASLREQASGENYYEGRFTKGAQYCPQAPKREEIGMYS